MVLISVYTYIVTGSGHGLMVRIHVLLAASREFKKVNGGISLLSSNKVSRLTSEQTLPPGTGNNNVEYKLISVPLMITLIAVCI